MKKIVKWILIALLLIVVYATWCVFGPTVSAPSAKYFYINTGATYSDVKAALLKENIVSHSYVFEKIAQQASYPSNVKPGRYEIKNGSSLLSLVRKLKSGNQSPVKLVINKLRTKEDLAQKIGKNFECDSTQVIDFINNNDSLKTYGLDTNTVMTIVIPNTYLLQWNGGFKKIFLRLQSEQQKFWTDERKQKAQAKNLTTGQVYTMASIVEEETNKAADKGLIASVYLNRLDKGMRLEADPTVKYAMRNFALKRILHGHLAFNSPYNTYLNSGLPPGPICTPSATTIDAVLNAPSTTYLYFVAKPDFDGYSNFASSYPEHLVNAKAYQHALDSLILSKQQK
ncbi:MAG: endolytic transglycosylase MltG [Bacteroidetes bacterium]|nr:endolytic transglycosylase MltG [Bacteroidota bacterium]